MIAQGKCFTNEGRTYWFPAATPKPKGARKVDFIEVTESDAVEFNKEASAIQSRLSARRPTPQKTSAEAEAAEQST